jgi:hypothetical protein
MIKQSSNPQEIKKFIQEGYLVFKNIHYVRSEILVASSKVQKIPRNDLEHIKELFQSVKTDELPDFHTHINRLKELYYEFKQLVRDIENS